MMNQILFETVWEPPHTDRGLGANCPCCLSLSVALAVQVVVVPKEGGGGELALTLLHTLFLVLHTHFVAS